MSRNQSRPSTPSQKTWDAQYGTSTCRINLLLEPQLFLVDMLYSTLCNSCRRGKPVHQQPFPPLRGLSATRGKRYNKHRDAYSGLPYLKLIHLGDVNDSRGS